MRAPISVLASLLFALLALGGPPAWGYSADDRWIRTATNGTNVGPEGTPITLTWSFAPDDTVIPGNTMNSTTPSILMQFLDSNWGVGPGGSDLTLRPWFPIFANSYERLSAVSGLTFVYEPNDDNNDFSNANNSSARGVLGVRGDLRLGGRSYGNGSNVLASNFFPDYGEMMINTDKTGFFLNATDDYRAFRNTIMHETMHGVGISHVVSSDGSFLIEPFLGTTFDGPQLDDLLALQRLYGDIFEKNGGNDTFNQSTQLAELSVAQPIMIGALGDSAVLDRDQVDFLSIDDNSDTDFFRFTVDTRLDVSLALTPRGASYMVGPEGGSQDLLNSQALSNLSLALVDANGTSLLATADDNGAGFGEQIVRQLMPGTYYARVKGADDDIQLYGLNISAAATLPKDLVWVGNESGSWDVGTTANFNDGDGSTAFFDFDNVTFDDSSTVRTVNLDANISAGNIRVSTANSYRFEGAGGIVAGNLTIDGPGLVELANSGNSFSGQTQIAAGTLKISSDASAMLSPISVAVGAALVISDDTDLASPLSVAGSGPDGQGVVQFDEGVTTQLSGDVLLTSANAMFRARDGSSVDMTGSIDGTANSSRMILNVGESGFAHLHGPIQLAGGGVTKLGSGTAELAGMIDYSGATNVAQGTLRLTGSGTLSGTALVAAQGTLEFAGEHELTPSSRISGSGTIAGDLTMPGTIAPGSMTAELTFANNLSLTATSRLELDIAGTEVATDFDTIAVGGVASLAGFLDVTLAGEFAPAFGELFEILHADGGVFGQFVEDDELLPDLGAGLEWRVVYSNFSVLLEVIAANAVLLPGDYNQDNVVNALDYVVWRRNAGTENPLPNDAFGGEIDERQFSQWRANFGNAIDENSSSFLDTSSTSAVPEPAALWIAFLAVAIALTGRFERALLVARH